jgi:heat shock protein HslJ
MGFFQSRAALLAACCISGLITAACATKAPPALSSDLAGTHWAVQTIDGRPVLGRAPSVSFAHEDRISGAAGCNSFFGIYEAENGAIDVRALGHTERACELPVMSMEQSFLSVLDKADRYEREDNRLVITAEDGHSLVLTPSA